MTVNVNEMIYLKDNRIYFRPYLKEYDITDHIQELMEQLEALKRGYDYGLYRLFKRTSV